MRLRFLIRSRKLSVLSEHSLTGQSAIPSSSAWTRDLYHGYDRH